MPWKVTYFFTQAVGRIGGWSENFWNSQTDQSGVILAADRLNSLLEALHGRSSYIIGRRISAVATFRRVAVNTWTQDTFNAQVSPATLSDYPTTSLLMVLRSNPDYVTRQWTKGIPDAVVDNGGFYKPTSTYARQVETFFRQLREGGNGWCLRVLDRGQANKIVQAITQAGIVTVAAHGYDNNDLVRISRARGMTVANAIWRITVIDANSFSLQGWTGGSTTPVYEGNGVVRRQIYAYPAISDCSIDRATKHNVGRPFALLSGRRRRRRT